MKSKEFVKQEIELAEKSGIKGMETWGYLFLAYLDLKSGNPEQALENYSKAIGIWGKKETPKPPEEEPIDLYFKGLAHLEMGSMSEALKTADEIEEITNLVMNKKLKRMHHLFKGMIELKKRNYSKAIEFSRQAVSLLPFQYLLSGNDTQARYIEPLALSYYLAGDLEKSQKEYERITFLTSGRLTFGDIYSKSFYMLGKIYEEQGDITKAIEHYEKFLSLWKDADPGLHEVEDARKRLAGLKGS